MAAAETSACDILLVDDDVQLAGTLAAALRCHGYAVRLAAHGRAAMDQLSRGRFRLVITDVFMPEADGIELLAFLRRLTPAPPVLAISGEAENRVAGMLHIAGQLGATRTLAKPFALAQFLEKVRELAGPPVSLSPPAARPGPAAA